MKKRNEKLEQVEGGGGGGNEQFQVFSRARSRADLDALAPALGPRSN